MTISTTETAAWYQKNATGLGSMNSNTGTTPTKRAVTIAMLNMLSHTWRSSPATAPRYSPQIQRAASVNAMSISEVVTTSSGSVSPTSQRLAIAGATAANATATMAPALQKMSSS